MDSNHLLSIMFVACLIGAGLSALIGVASIPSAIYRAKHRHDHQRLHFIGTCVMLTLFFAAIAAVVYFTVINSQA